MDVTWRKDRFIKRFELLMDRRPLNIEASDRHPKLLLSSGHRPGT
jgi:hypothetical protein